MKRKWVRRIVLVLLIPIIIFALLIVSLYIPSVQNFIQKKATSYVSEATGMDISIGRVDLRFPLNLLVRDVTILQEKDTMLSFSELNVSVQVLPLLKKKVMLNTLMLNQAKVNTRSLIDGVKVKGTLGDIKVGTRLVDLDTSIADFTDIYLDQINLLVVLADTTETKSDEEPLDWTILLDNINLTNSSVDLQMPLDSMTLGAHLPSLNVRGVNIDLGAGNYGVSRIDLSEAALTYQSGSIVRQLGVDPNNLDFKTLSLSFDSVFYGEKLIQANIETFSFLEKSGIQVNSLEGRLKMTDEYFSCSNLSLRTPLSLFTLGVDAPLNWCNDTVPTQIDASIHLSLKELAMALGVKDEDVDISTWGPIIAKVKASGTADNLRLDEVYAELSDSFIFTIQGAAKKACDENKRVGQVDLLGDFYDLSRFESWIADDGSIRIPKQMLLKGIASINGSKIHTQLSLNQGKGVVNLEADYDTANESYRVSGDIDSLNINHFIPNQPLYNLSLGLQAKGSGIDFMSNKSQGEFDLHLNELRYDHLAFRKFNLSALLNSGKLQTKISSDNPIVKGTIDGYYILTAPMLNLNYQVSIEDIDLYKLGLSKQRIKDPVNITADLITDNDSVCLTINSGDFAFHFDAHQSFNELLDQSTLLMKTFMAQLKKKDIDYNDLQKHLPEAHLAWEVGQKNVISSLLSQNKINYTNSTAKFEVNPLRGMHGWMGVGGFKVDSLKLDSIIFTLDQDTTGIRVETGVVKGKKNQETAFRSFVRGFLSKSSASIDLDFETGNNMKGLLFGVNIMPVGKGTYVTLTPDEPIIAFRKFKFKDKKNWLVLRDDFRVFADIDMEETRQIGFKMTSNLKDTTSLQNMNIDIREIQLNDITRLFPFLPQLDGVFSAETHYVQTDSTLQVSTELFIDSLQYEKKLIGDLSLGATWLPDGKNSDLINMYLTHNHDEVLMVDGVINRAGEQDVVDVNAVFEHFPLKVANVLFPEGELALDGDIDGHLHITGSADAPKINGELILDSVTIFSKQAGAKFTLDSRPVVVKDSKIVFNDFAIYSTDQNPFKINGTVDITNLSEPVIDLKLTASNYTLINAKRTKESILYGKLFVGVNATVRGTLDALKMRGNMSVLDNTDLTYVLTESPLTVQDRLGDLVQFTSFRDTTEVHTDTIPRELGGIDMVMAIHIDPSVQFKVDLSADRSSRIALQGGGDLSMQYTPQGEFFLNGRYALSGGIIKYSLPVIPSKEFQISNDSYIEWTGKVDNPKLNLLASDRVRASVSEADGSSHMVNFDVIIGAKNRLDNLQLVFDVNAPDNSTVQNQLASMGQEERSKQAIALLATGVYLASSGSGGKGGLDMGAALNSVLQSQINAIAGSSLKNASLSVGVEEYDMSEAGGKRTDYSFRYSQRFLNNRFQISLGGRIKTGVQAENDFDSFIDNVSLEYRLDASGTRFVRIFHNKNYESVLEGEITETGVGLILRKKLNRLGELFIFKKKKKQEK